MNETEIALAALNASNESISQMAQLGAMPVPAPSFDLWGFDPLTLGVAAFIVGVVLLLVEFRRSRHENAKFNNAVFSHLDLEAIHKEGDVPRKRLVGPAYSRLQAKEALFLQRSQHFPYFFLGKSLEKRREIVVIAAIKQHHLELQPSEAEDGFGLHAFTFSTLT